MAAVPPSKETTLVPFPPLLGRSAPRRTKKFGGKFHPRDCALSFAKAKGKGEQKRIESIEKEREAESSGVERNDLLEIIVRSWKKICRVLFHLRLYLGRTLSRKIGERRNSSCLCSSSRTFGAVCGNRAFQRSEADTELDESGEEGGEEREESKKRARWKT